MPEIISNDPLWYKDAVIYELHVRSFYDSNADGIGDFQGLIQKLDYLQFLGVNTLWLLPFYPSPLKDDGYDIANYLDVNPSYGTLADFKQFLREAHKRDIRVITELVLNHTSNLHEWFQKSRHAKPNSKWRNYYVWSDTPERYQEARIIFKDFESSNWSWDPVANAYYWHRFYSHQPDLNYDNPDVQKAMIKIVDFWLKMGVDGLRLDAVPYLYERDGTNCENLPEGHTYLKFLRQHIDTHYKDRFLLAEANQWPEDAIAYFGNGDECQMAFHFPVMPRMYMSVKMEDRFPLVDILQQTPPIPTNCQWATFLRNHDELTLEMVTDEERDYMNRIYAQDPQMRINVGIRRRLAPLMTNDRIKIELMNGILFSLPGTPVIYYGDEIGMGDNIYLGDRNGVRTPMQWNGDRNAGFSTSNPQQLFFPVIIDPEYNYEAVNVELQKHNSLSLLWWMKRLILLRQKYKAFGRGSIEFLFPENSKILAFFRIYNEEHILVVINLSRFVQYVELDLSQYIGRIPVELFGETVFPAITKTPYFITLNPHAFFYFKLEPPQLEQANHSVNLESTPLRIKKNWDELFNLKMKDRLEKILGVYITGSRWFRSKAQKISGIKIVDEIPLMKHVPKAYIVLIEVEYKEIENEVYLLPLTAIEEEASHDIKENYPQAIIAHLEKDGGKKAVLVDALYVPTVGQCLLELCVRKKQIVTQNGYLYSEPILKYQEIFPSDYKNLPIKPVNAEQTNTSLIFDQKGILKIYRRSDAGINPDLEIGLFLTKTAQFSNTPRIIAALEYTSEKHVITLGMLQEFITNQGDAWNYTLDALRLFLDQAIVKSNNQTELKLPKNIFISEAIPDEVYQSLGAYAHAAILLGERTGDMHLALACETQDKNFKSELFTTLDQRSLYQSMTTLARKVLQGLAKTINKFDESIKKEVTLLLNNEDKIFNLAKQILSYQIKGQKIRCHGDYHLGQVLYTGKDFVIIDFEGEPARALSERRIKKSPLKDVAGMLRSFHYAKYSALLKIREQSALSQYHHAEEYALYWYQWVCHLFVKGYLSKAGAASFLPATDELRTILLKSYMLEKTIYEINYEINNRPDWIQIPCRGMLELIGVNVPRE